jgi:hypothetical protein
VKQNNELEMLSVRKRWRLGMAAAYRNAGLKNNAAMIVKSGYVNHALLEND